MYHTPMSLFPPHYLYLQPDPQSTTVEIMDHFTVKKEQDDKEDSNSVNASTVTMPPMDEDPPPSSSLMVKQEITDIQPEDLFASLKQHPMGHLVPPPSGGPHHHPHQAENDRFINWIRCIHCNFKTRTKQNLKNHMLRRHTEDHKVEWIHCSQSQCDYKTIDKSNFRKHALKKHADGHQVEWLHCSYSKCNFKTKVREYMHRHTLRKHTDQHQMEWFHALFYTNNPPYS